MDPRSSLSQLCPDAVTKSLTPTLDGSRRYCFMLATPSPRSIRNTSSRIWCRQYTKKIQEQEDSLDSMSGKLAELNNTVLGLQANISEKQTTISELEECLRKNDFENEHLKSKVATLRERYEMVFAQSTKIRLLEEQSKVFHEGKSKFDSEIVHDTQDNSEKDLILSLQTQLKETAKLVVRFSDDKYCALKEIESLKVEIKSLQTENQDLKSRESELNNLEKVYETKEFVLLKDIDQMKSQVSKLLEKLKILDQ
ncbi:hypothetical protein Tco_1194690 [Tanacetum coccineum]